MNTGRGKFFVVEHETVDVMLPKVGHLAFAVYCLLKRHMNTNTNQCFPSIQRIMRVCGCNRNGAVKAIKTLEVNNMVFVKRTTGKSNVYTMASKERWGVERHNLDGIVMNCPECNIHAVRKGMSFCCPKCLMDVGAYVEDVMRFHFPKVRKADIYGWNRRDEGHNNRPMPDAYYEDILAHGEHPVPVPNYETKDVYIDFDIVQ